MLDAIRNLGILKMIQEFPDVFNHEALESVDKFLDQRENAIEKGIYGKLQFEPIDDEEIGVYSINGDEISFKKEKIIDDSSEYLFRSPPGSQDAYTSPSWKVSKGNKKIDACDKKLESTIEEFREYYERHQDIAEVRDVFEILLKIFDSKNVLTADATGKIVRQSFWEIFKNHKQHEKNKKGINFFTVKIDGKFPGKIPILVKYALERIAKRFYQPVSVNFNRLEIKVCSLCKSESALFPNVLSGIGLNISNIDKPGFFPNVTKENAAKSFPLCARCAEALFAGKKLLNDKLRQSISGHPAWIIPHLLQSQDKQIMNGVEILSSALTLIKKEVSPAKGTEAGIIEDLAGIKGISTVSFLFGEIVNIDTGKIRKFLPDVLPSRLSEIAKAIHEINGICNAFPNEHPWILWEFKKKQKTRRNPLNGTLQIIRNVLGKPKYDKQNPKGTRKPFKASTVDSLDLLGAIFLKKAFPLGSILPEFSAKLSYDFLGALSDEKQNPVYVMRDNIAQMEHLLKFLDKLGVIKMTENKNMVGKYLEGCKGLEPLNRFFNEEATGLDDVEKQYTFLVGLLFGKLIAFQQQRRVSNNALRWLKGLEIGTQDLMEIFIKTRSKLDDYSFQRPAWSEEMRGVAEVIGALGSAIGSTWILSRREVPYYFCLGQSLSGFYLPGKGNDSKSDNIQGGNKNERADKEQK